MVTTITARLIAQKVPDLSGTNRNKIVRRYSLCHNSQLGETFCTRGYQVLACQKVVPKVVKVHIFAGRQNDHFLHFRHFRVFCAKRHFRHFYSESSFTPSPDSGKGVPTHLFQNRHFCHFLTESPLCAKLTESPLSVFYAASRPGPMAESWCQESS